MCVMAVFVVKNNCKNGTKNKNDNLYCRILYRGFYHLDIGGLLSQQATMETVRQLTADSKPFMGTVTGNNRSKPWSRKDHTQLAKWRHPPQISSQTCSLRTHKIVDAENMDADERHRCRHAGAWTKQRVRKSKLKGN